MGDPVKDKKALDELKQAVEYGIKPALKRYTDVRPRLKTGLVKLDAAVLAADSEVIAFEQRGVTAFKREVGSVIQSIDDAIDSLTHYADDPDYEAGQAQAAGHVRALGAAKKELALWVARATRHLSRADALLKKVVVRSGYVEAQWAKLGARVKELEGYAESRSSSMVTARGRAYDAAKSLDAAALEKARAWSYEIAGDGFLAGQIKEVKTALATFEADIKKVKPSAEFMNVYPGERNDANDRVAGAEATLRELLKVNKEITELKVKLDVRKIAETLGWPADVIEKIGPQLSQNDSAKLKALDSMAKKHAPDKSAKDLLAALQKRGLVSRA